MRQVSANHLDSESSIVAGWGDLEPLVSISCITYNHGEYVEDALIGFLIQKTSFPFEILIHDDASEDCTPKIIKKYKDKYPSIIKPICQTENQYSQGVSPAFINAERARGKYIAICEGDDFWVSKNHLQNAVQALSIDPDFSIYVSSCYIEKIDQRRTSAVCLQHNEYDLNDYIMKNPFVATCSIVVRRSLWIEISKMPVLGGRYFALDTRLKLIALTKGRMVCGSDPEVLYRKGAAGSWSTRAIDERLIVSELLDNLAILREVGYLNNYQACEALMLRVEDEVLKKRAAIQAEKGLVAWLIFVMGNLKVLSKRNIKSVLYVLLVRLNRVLGRRW